MTSDYILLISYMGFSQPGFDKFEVNGISMENPKLETTKKLIFSVQKSVQSLLIGM